MSFPTSSKFDLTSTRSAAEKLNHHRSPADDYHHHHHQELLPGLPNEIAQHCLSLVPPSILYSVCRSWRRLIYASSFPPFLSIYAVVSTTHKDQIRASNSIGFCSFDPISAKWHLLPPVPGDPPPRFLFRHPSYINRDFPIQTVSVSGKLVVIAASDPHFAPSLSQPLVFNPLSKEWSHGPPFPVPRRWCAAGALRGELYMAGGIAASYRYEVAQLVEKLDMDCQQPFLEHRRRRMWRKVKSLNDSKFSIDAIDAVAWRGKLCMVAAREGIVYDVETDCWEKMPRSMLAGWRGPAATMAEETLYAVDQTAGLLRKYIPQWDSWTVVAESPLFIGSQQIAAAGGRVCVLCADMVRIVVVNVRAPRPERLMAVVDVPPGILVLGIHIMPRLIV